MMAGYVNKCLFAALSVIFCNFSIVGQVNKSITPRPNILFIMGDDHTSQAWGVYGGILKEYVQNRNIKRLVEAGTLLTNSFCTNSICTPSRGSILTGQYSHVNGVFTLYDSLVTKPDQVTSVATLLQNSGYQTALIGKWHLVTKPTGFDYFNILPGQGKYQNPVLKSETNWNNGGEVYKGFSEDIIADQTIEWLKKNTNDKPFFVMCHFKAPHEPFDYPERYSKLYDTITLPEPASLYDFNLKTTGRSFTGRTIEYLTQKWKEESRKEPSKSEYPGLPFSASGLDSLQNRKKTYQKFIKDYLRSAAAIDDNIGKLLDYLESTGLDENTIIIYTSDQGYFLGEHGFIDKRMMYEESMRMPFVISYPKEIPRGKKRDDIILNIDFAPLLLDYAGVSCPTYMQGRSFRQNLRGNPQKDWRKAMYYRYWAHQTFRPAHFGIRNHRYKLIFYYGLGLNMEGNDRQATNPAWEFFDLKKDHHELKNNYANPRYQKIIRKLKKELLAVKKEVNDTDDRYPEVQKLVDRHLAKQ